MADLLTLVRDPAVEIAAIAGLSSVILVMLMGQPRIFFSMANDGLLPAVFAKVHPRFKTPYVTTVVTGIFATIIGGMLLGLSRKAATDFSFYLAIPTLIGAGVYSLYKERALLSLADVPLFAVGLVFSFISAWACVRWLLRYISTHSFVPFAWYRIAFGLVVLLTAYQGWVIWKP